MSDLEQTAKVAKNKKSNICMIFTEHLLIIYYYLCIINQLIFKCFVWYNIISKSMTNRKHLFCIKCVYLQEIQKKAIKSLKSIELSLIK